MMKFRFDAYDPATGEFLRAMPAPTKAQIGDVFGARGTLQLEFAGAPEIPTFLEIRASVYHGGEWEPVGPSYLRLSGSHQDTDPAGMRSAQFVSREWVLGRARVGPGELELIDGKRPFYQATPGQIMRTLILEAQDRGAAAGIELSGFSDAVDTAGNTWTRSATIYYSPSLPIGDVLANLVEQGMCDYRMEGNTLELFEPETAMGNDLTTGGNPVRLRGAVTEAPVSYTLEDLTTSALLIGEDGFQVEVDNPSAPDDYGRMEVTIEQGGVNSEGTARTMIDAELQRGSREVRQITRSQHSSGAPFLPYRDYRVGDFVQAFDQGEWQRYRVRELQMELGDSGWTIHAVLNDRLEELLLRLANRTNGIVNGSKGSGGDGTRPALPPAPGIEPAAPEGLVLDQQVYLDGNGDARGVITAGWGEVTESVRGLAIDIGSYELWRRDNETHAPWRMVSRTDGALEATDSPVWLTRGDGSAAEYQWRVRATSQASGKGGQWSNVVTLTMTQDTTPPPPPSAPVAETGYRIVSATWDGLDENGLEMPVDFSHVQVYLADTESMAGARPGGAIFFPSTWNSGTLPSGVDVWVAFTAVDRVGNESAMTPAVSVTPQALVDEESIQAEVDSINGIINDAVDELQENIDNIVVDADGTTTYQTPTEPDASTDPPPKAGDIWFDSSDNMKLYRHDGSGWVSASDERIQIIQDAQDQFGQDITDAEARALAEAQALAEQARIDAEAEANNLAEQARVDAESNAAADAQVKADAARDAAITEAETKDQQVRSDIDTVIDGARQDLESQINTVRSSVDGKNAITQSVDAPPTSYDGAVGDRWERMSSMGSGGSLVSNWRWNGNVWVSTIISDAVLGNVDAAKIGTGYLDAERIRAGSISADQLAVGVSQNLVVDSRFKNSELNAARFTDPWVTVDSGNETWIRNATEDTSLDRQTFYLTTSGSGAPEGARIPVSLTTKWQMTVEVRVSTGNTSGINRLIASLLAYRADGSYRFLTRPMTRTDGGGQAIPTDGLWYKVETLIEWDYWDEEFSSVAPRVYVDGGEGGSYVWFRNPFIGEQSGSTLIEDGAITTDKIAVGSITAASGIIASLDAGVITTGYLDADRIDAGTITGDKLIIGGAGNLIPGANRWAQSDAGWSAFEWDQDNARVLARGEGTSYTDEYFWLEPGRYLVEANVGSSRGAGRTYIGFRGDFDGDGGDRNRNVLSDFNGSASGEMEVYRGVSVRVRIVYGYQGALEPGEVTFINSVSIRSMAPGTLIEDGAITTDKILANAITAGKIDADAITASKIAADAVGANAIAAGVIDAGHIVVGGLRADQILVGGSIGGDLIEDGSIGATLIEDDAITTGKIRAGAITATSGIVESLNAGVLTAGTIDAARIGANTITGDKLLVGNFENMISDVVAKSGEIDPHRRGSGGASLTTQGASADVQGVDPGPHLYGVTYGGSEDTYYQLLDFGGHDGTTRIPVESERAYRLSALIRAGGSYPSGMPYIQWSFYEYDASGASLGLTALFDSNYLLSWSWQELEGTFTPQAGATHVRVVMRVYQPNSGVRIAYPTLRPMVSGTLIEDGAITTDKILANAITAGKIDALAIEAGHIAANAVEADTIAGGAIDGKLITGATIRTSASGARVLLNTNGIFAYNSSGSISSSISAHTGAVDLTGDISQSNSYGTARFGPQPYSSSTASPGLRFDVPGYNWWGPGGVYARKDSTSDFAETRMQGFVDGPNDGSSVNLAPGGTSTSASTSLRRFYSNGSTARLLFGADRDATLETGGGDVYVRSQNSANTSSNADVLLQNNGNAWMTAKGNVYVYTKSTDGAVNIQKRNSAGDKVGASVVLDKDGAWFGSGGSSASYVRALQGDEIAIAGATLNVYRVPSGSGVTLQQSGARIYRASSSRDNKLRIEDASYDLPDLEDKLLSVRARSWYEIGNSEAYAEYLDAREAWTPLAEGEDCQACEDGSACSEHAEPDPVAVPRRNLGAVAEEVEELGLESLVVYDANGKPDGLMYDRFGVMLIPAVKRLRDRVDELESTIEELRK